VQLDEADSPAFAGPYLVQSSPRAMLRFALGSSCTIATLLCIPDGIGILPGSANPLAWCIRLVGLWFAAYILWTFGFLAMLYFVRLLGGGIEIREDGLKLWRFGKLIQWNSIKAISCEPQPFFRRAFCLPDMVYRLTLYREKKGLTGKPELTAQHIPSFQIDPDEFRSLLVYISQQCYGTVPAAAHTLFAETEIRPLLKQTFQRGRIMRIVVSAFIMLSLVSFLARRACTNYFFNMGNREFRQEHYQSAANYYKQATAFDPMFAPSWDRLARCESRYGNFRDAEIHWRIALQRKPDFVESKIGLSTIVMNRFQYTEAKRLLESAVRLSPTNVAAFINLANLDLLMQDPGAAQKLLEPIVVRDRQNVRAHALLVRAYVLQGNLAQAEQSLKSCDTSRSDTAAADMAFFNSVRKELSRAEEAKTDREKRSL
jgi:cytochrome c-type biogenesis protein CcmH/NrfG